MILCDAGPLIAIVDKSDARHVQCNALLYDLTPPLLTTWACVTEAMYMAGRRAGYQGQAVLWKLLEAPSIVLPAHRPSDMARMRDLMAQYQDLPMDLADASLVALAESLNLTRIFTLDSDFQIYRLPNNTPFQILP